MTAAPDVAAPGHPPAEVRRRDYVLPKVPTPHADESLPGLLMRTAEPFRFHDPRRLFKRLDLPKHILATLCQADPAGEQGRLLRAALRLDETAFRRLTLWTDDVTTVSILGEPVWRELVRPEVRAVCPLCLEESQHHRAVWLVDLLPVCARHGARLIERCPAPGCGRRLDWSGAAVHRCGALACRFDLRKAEAVRVEPERLGAVVALDALLHGRELDAKGHLELPFGTALKLSFILGKMSLGIERRGRAPGLIRREIDRIPEILREGWRALDDWPRGFHALLEARRAQAAGRAGKDGLTKAFGSLAKYVHEWVREPWGAPIGAAFAEYAAAQPDLATTSHTLRRYAPGTEVRHLHVSLSQAQQMLGISPATMQAIAERRGMYVLPPRGSGTPSLLRADGVQELQRELDGFLLIDQARAILGVGHRVMRQMEPSGLLAQVPLEERVMESRIYRRSAVEELVSACVGSARRVTRAQAKSEGLTLVTRATAPGRTVPDICRALADGRLRSAATVRAERGLMRIRVRMEDVERVLPAARETLSIVDAARLMGIGCGYRHLHVWKRRGLLRAVPGDKRGERGARVEREEWERFRREYVTGGELADLFQQKGNFWLSRHLKHQSVLPVSGPGVDEGELALFRRADCTPEVMRAVRLVQARPPGTPQEKHRLAFARALVAAKAVAALWGTEFRRVNNRFTDEAGGRVLQVVSGRRPDLTGVFSFSAAQTTLERLRALPGAWVALVPAQGDTFLLAPFGEIPWRGATLETGYITVRFDGRGRPLEMAEWAVPLPGRADP